MHDVTGRLALMERRLRRTQLLASAALVALVLFVGVAAAQKPAAQDAPGDLEVKELTAESISTGSITIRDDANRPRVSIRVGEDGGPFVALLDDDSRVRLLLTLHENEQPLVQLSNADESPQMNLFYNKNLGSALIMFGTAGRALYAVPTGATPMIEFNDADGEKIFTAP